MTAPRLRAALETYADGLLRDWTEAIEAGHERPSEKVLNDPVWRSIRLHAWEVGLLDSPLLQRLRYIRQLGCAHFTYPGAGYSRLEHSVGVLHQVQRLVHSINDSARERVIRGDDEVALRLAGLLHDCGHVCFSHVTETCYGRAPGLARIRRDLRERFDARKLPSPSEAIGAVMLLSPAFRRLFEGDALGVPVAAKQRGPLLERIVALILGGIPDPERPFLAELVNGPFDADKLDYIPRDAHMAGVPSPLDVERLILKVRALRVGPDRAARLGLHVGSGPRARASADGASRGTRRARASRSHARMDARMDGAAPSGARPPARGIWVAAIGLAGGRSVEELLLSRILLYDKLYYHPKVRATEVMVRGALELLADTGDPRWNLPGLLDLSDDGLLSFLADPAAPDADAERRAQVLLHWVRMRRLFKRSFAFARRFLGERAGAAAGWKTLLAVLRSETRTRALRRAITEEAAAIEDAAGGTGADGAELFDQLVGIDLPDASRVASGGRALVGDRETGLDHFHTYFTLERWAASYRFTKQTGYVYAPAPLVRSVHLACERVFAAWFGLDFGSGAADLAKLDRSEIEQWRARAVRKPAGGPGGTRRPRRIGAPSAT